MSGPSEIGGVLLRRRWTAVLLLILSWLLFAAVAALRLFRRRRPAPPQGRYAATTPEKPEPAPAGRCTNPGAAHGEAPELHAVKIGFESGEIRSRLIFSIVFGWFVFVFVGLAILMRVYDEVPALPHPPPETRFPAPRLNTQPNAVLAPYEAAQQRALTKTALPIGRAMAQVAHRADPYAPIGAGGAQP